MQAILSHRKKLIELRHKIFTAFTLQIYVFEETLVGCKERSSIAIERLVCCSNRSNFFCTPHAIFDSRVIFTVRFLCLRLKIEIFSDEKDTQHANKITKQFVVFCL